MQQHVYKRRLDNGLTILVAPQHTLPKVSMQLWYDVGAKDEHAGQRGVAHYIEHMIFKGTKSLSESDINNIVHKLSGSCNAFTSHDYTGFMFEMPSQHWYKVLPIMADCMQNATFNEQHLSSELRAILQEIRMYRDDYPTSALEQLTQHIFADHPYRHPIIGYQSELVQLTREDIQRFYNAFYMPNNATLVIVGDTTVEEAVAQAEKAFGYIPAGTPQHHRIATHQRDIHAHSVTLYRDVQQPTVMLSWEIPGFQAQDNYLWDVISWIIGSGRGSRLYRRLMTQEQLVTDIQSFVHDLFAYGQFIIYLQPHDMQDVPRITNIIMEEIDACMHGGISSSELERAQRKARMDYISVFEDIERHAYLLGKHYLATGDENALSQYIDEDPQLGERIEQALCMYLRSSVMHTAQILPVPEPEKAYLQQVQHEVDRYDEAIISRCVRTQDVEPPRCTLEIQPEPAPAFTFPRPQRAQLSNGATLLYHHREDTDKVEVVIDLKAKHFYDPEDKQGLYLCMTEVLQEGTVNYSAQELAEEIEHYGMSLNTAPGSIQVTMLRQDMQKGLQLLREILTNASCDEQAIERVRQRLLSDVARFWDTPTQFSSQLLRQAVYREHPYHKSVLGTEETLQRITQKDIRSAYAHYVVPDQAYISIVGNITGCHLQDMCEDALASWHSKKAPALELPSLEKPVSRVIDYTINRDQTVLCYAGLSVSRFDEDFHALLLFDQNFTGGVLDSMHSQLFQLREQSGLFYAAGGSMLAGSGRGPGMILIKSIISQDQIEDAQERMKQLIRQAPDAYTQEDHEEAQRAIINTLADHFATAQQTAQTFVSMQRFALPDDYFDKRAEHIRSIDRETVQETARAYLDLRHMITLRVGRIETSSE